MVKDVKLVQSQKVALKHIEPNKGQVVGLPTNPRFIKDDKYKKLVKSITENPEMTALRELLLFPTGKGKYVIIGGNMRYHALKELGYEEAICKVLPADTSVEALKAYTIKDNAGFGEWDFDLLANDWDADLLCEWGVDIPQVDTEGGVEEEAERAQEDDYEVEVDREKDAKTQYGDVYQLGPHRLICGDSTDENTYDELLDGGKADLLITDPPYNVNYEGKTKDALKIKNDKQSDSNFFAFLSAFYSCASDALKGAGVFYVFYAQSESRNFITAIPESLQVKEYLIWLKNTMVLGRQDYQWKHEPILYGWKQADKDNTAHCWRGGRAQTTILEQTTKSEDLRKKDKAELIEMLEQVYANASSDIIFCEKPTRSELHPTMKPIKLFAQLISNSSNPGELVLDAFGGSGTTIMACEQMKRKARVIVLDRHYCDVIIDRWEKLTGEKAVLIRNVADKIKSQTIE